MMHKQGHRHRVCTCWFSPPNLFKHTYKNPRTYSNHLSQLLLLLQANRLRNQSFLLPHAPQKASSAGASW